MKRVMPICLGVCVWLLATSCVDPQRASSSVADDVELPESVGTAVFAPAVSANTERRAADHSEGPGRREPRTACEGDGLDHVGDRPELLPGERYDLTLCPYVVMERFRVRAAGVAAARIDTIEGVELTLWVPGSLVRGCAVEECDRNGGQCDDGQTCLRPGQSLDGMPASRDPTTGTEGRVVLFTPGGVATDEAGYAYVNVQRHLRPPDVTNGARYVLRVFGQ